MSPLFGSKDTKHDDRPGDAEALAEAQRLAALPLPQLAAEVMDKGFNPGPASDGLPTVRMIAEDIAPGLAGREPDAFQSLYDIVGEGMQLLEHACLIRYTVWSSQGGVFFTATRLGRAALAQGKVEHLLTGGTL